MLKIKTDYRLAYAIEHAYKRLFFAVVWISALAGLGFLIWWGADHHPYITLGAIIGFVVFVALVWFVGLCAPTPEEELNDANSPLRCARDNRKYK